MGMIKHAHHQFDIDHPGKDSYRLRKAGARQMLIASTQRWALMKENDSPQEPALNELIQHFDAVQFDLVIVEGFKNEAIAKIEVHRAALNHPLLAASDPNFVAIACDTVLSLKHPIPQLDLNNPSHVSDFVRSWLETQRSQPPQPR